MIEKFKILSGRTLLKELPKRKKDYNFDPQCLQELVTKRPSFQDFKHSLRYMNKSFNIIKNLGKKVTNDSQEMKVKLPIGKIIANNTKAKLLTSEEKRKIIDVSKK